MRDTKDHFILMMNAAQGVMGYWDKGRQNRVFTLEVTTDHNLITVEISQDERQGKDPHGWLLSVLCALITGAIAFAFFYFLVKASPVLCGVLTVVIAAMAVLLVQLNYHQEYRRFRRLLDRYMKEIRRAELVRQETKRTEEK